ncbi:MAG: threonine synthase [Xanthomonadaceae bacterium]|nr:threonine synthase [Xanthomonadaceae bacterium]
MLSCLTHFECTRTGAKYPRGALLTLSDAGAPLFARYDLERAAATLSRASLRGRRADMWRYAEVLPDWAGAAPLSLGEGWTPLAEVERLRDALRCPHLFIKDESSNPTGSFKARGLSCAVNGALARRATAFAVPTAGNAGGALAAFAAAAGVPAHVFMPADTPAAFALECRAFGATVELIDGLIDECGRQVAARAPKAGWHNVSTLKEPFRVEGKKTMGYEVAEQLAFELPDVIVYPTGGGTGLIGMWKAFDEMEELGWIGSRRPRMVSVQAAGCAPIVQAFADGADAAAPWPDAHTVASGLRVPSAVGDFLMLRALRDSGGHALAVEDDAMLAAGRELARLTGIFPAPEGGAALAALYRLLDEGLVDRDERIVLFNTGSGYKYADAYLR